MGQEVRPWMRQTTEIKSRDLTPITMPMVGSEVQIFLAPVGKSVDGTDQWRKIEGDPNRFDAIVNFGSLFNDRGMRASIIPEGERWKVYEEGCARLLEFHPNEQYALIARDAADRIIEVVNPEANFAPHLDPESIIAYKKSADTIVGLQKRIARERLAFCVPLVALRAGEPMTASFGCSTDAMVFFGAKRLNDISGNGGLAVGLRFYEAPDRLQARVEHTEGRVMNADPADATSATQTAIILYLLSQEVPLKQITQFSVGSSQQGLQLGNEFAALLQNQFGIDIMHYTARAHPTLTGGDHPYYIMTADRKYAVRDSGDMLAFYNKEGRGKLWPDILTRKHLSDLQQSLPQIRWNDFIHPGEPFSIHKFLYLQQHAREQYPRLPHDAIGKVLVNH